MCSFFQLFPPSGDCIGSSALQGSLSSFVWFLLRPLWAVMSMVTSSLACHLGSSYLWYCLSSMPAPCRVPPCGVAGRVSSSSVWPQCCGWGFFSVPHWSGLPLDWIDLILGLYDLVRLVSLTDSFMDFCSSSLTSLGLCCMGELCEVSIMPLPVPLGGIPPPCKCC